MLRALFGVPEKLRLQLFRVGAAIRSSHHSRSVRCANNKLINSYRARSDTPALQLLSLLRKRGGLPIARVARRRGEKPFYCLFAFNSF